MNIWMTKYLVAAVASVGALSGCEYCTALLATYLCVVVANHLGAARAHAHRGRARDCGRDVQRCSQGECA